ncbi:MAG: hypothetical protein NDJ89_15075 [Oligoflexia bacterium]|nr:hypothetical protein [Oligoflexia bacterium]
MSENTRSPGAKDKQPAEETRQAGDKRKPYQKPALRSESLTAVAALCNGSSTGGRKATTPTCNASRLKS